MAFPSSSRAGAAVPAFRAASRSVFEKRGEVQMGASGICIG